MRAVFGGGHTAVAYFEHVGIVPVSRLCMRVQRLVLVHNVHHSVAAPVSGTPLLLACPPVLNIAGGAPEVDADLLPPQPGLAPAPLANAEDDRAPAGIEGLAHIRVRSSGVLSR